MREFVNKFGALLSNQNASAVNYPTDFSLHGAGRRYPTNILFFSPYSVRHAYVDTPTRDGPAPLATF